MWRLSLVVCGAALMNHAATAQPGTQLYAGFTLVDPAARTLTPHAWLTVRGELIDETRELARQL